ncbi:MAG: hypothetical protein Q9210_001427 [Variospora velana]
MARSNHCWRTDRWLQAPPPLESTKLVEVYDAIYSHEPKDMVEGSKFGPVSPDFDPSAPEHEAVTRAIAASLAPPRSGLLPRAQDRWIPQTPDDWQVYHRQKALEEEMHDDLPSVENESPVLAGHAQISPPPKDRISKPSERNTLSTEPRPDTSETEVGTSQTQPPPRQTIDDRIKVMAMGNPVDLPWVNDDDGDTWVFIDPSAQQPEQSDLMYHAYVQRYEKPLTIRSATFRKLQSSFFNERLGSTFQYRTIRRRGLKNRLPPQIKYVLDLTPPTEGDEAVWLMSELCCVEGVRSWSQAGARWKVSKTLVGGHDEFTNPTAESGNSSQPPEVSPIRHRACIERVLNAIRGIDPILDSAVKVYTTYAVARLFDITESPLTDYIVRWLRAPPNSLFIEALPEIALKIGDGLQCSELVRDSFAILVGEEALEILKDEPTPGHSLYGRKRNDIPESYKTRIEYASKSFLGGVMQSFDTLTEYDMSWVETLPEFRKLLDNKNRSLDCPVNEMKAALKAFVRGNIWNILYTPLQWVSGVPLGSEGGDALYPRVARHEFWNSLSVAQRIMTPTLWQALMPPRFYSAGNNVAGITNLTDWASNLSGWFTEYSQPKSQSLIQERRVTEVSYSTLEVLAERCRNCGADWSACYKPVPTSIWTQPHDPWNASKRLLRAHRPPPGTDLASTATAKASKMFWDWQADPPGPRIVPNSTSSSNEPGLESPTTTTKAQQSSATRKAVGFRFDFDFELPPYGIDFDLPTLGMQAEARITAVCEQILRRPDAGSREPMDVDITMTLVCLGPAEWKYLPLYAGGLDDGSGGVFNDDVPVAEVGFSTAGPRVHTGTGSSAASSEFDLFGEKEGESTHHTSTVANDGFSDQLDRRRVYDDGNSTLWDEVMRGKKVDGSTTVESSTVGMESEDGFVLPVRQRIPDSASTTTAVGDGQTTEAAATNGEGGRASQNDDYSDIFMDSDDDTVTENGDDEDGLSDDEDMVLV